jgi:hypothetical protein
MRGAKKPKAIISKNSSDHRKRRLKNIGNGIDIDIAAGAHPFYALAQPIRDTGKTIK